MTKLDRMIKTASMREALTEEKQAAIQWGRLAYPVAAAGLVAGLTMGVIPAIAKAKKRRQEEETWDAIRKIQPEIAKAPGMREHFHAMHDITPKVMNHPTFAIPVLRQTADYGTEGIPLGVLAQASQAEYGSGGFGAPRSQIPDKIAPALQALELVNNFQTPRTAAI